MIVIKGNRLSEASIYKEKSLMIVPLWKLLMLMQGLMGVGWYMMNSFVLVAKGEKNKCQKLKKFLVAV